MTTLPVANKEVMNHLKSVWEADPTSLPVPIIWKKEDPPDTLEAWIRPTIIGGTSKRNGVGTRDRLYQETSVLVIQIFTTPNKGLNYRDELVNILLTGCRGKVTPSNVRFTDSDYVDLSKSGGWDQRNFSINFTYETSD